MSTTSFTNLNVRDRLRINEDYESSTEGLYLRPSILGSRGSDITGYTIKALNSSGKMIWAPAGAGANYSLKDLTDTFMPLSIPDGSVLKYSTTTSNWVPGTQTAAIADLTDVDVTGISDGNILLYNASSQKFELADLPSNVDASGQAGSLQFKDESGGLLGTSNIVWTDSTKELLLHGSSVINIGSISINGTDIVGLPSVPVGATSAASKSYVDATVSNLSAGLSWKEFVDYATSSSDDYSVSMATLLTTQSMLSIDGNNTFSVGERILFKDNATAQETNGIYRVKTAAHPLYTIERAYDLDTGSSASGAVMWIDKGTSNEGYAFRCLNESGSDITGTDALVFVDFNANTSDVLEAGSGLERLSNSLNIKFNANVFDVDTNNTLDITNSGVTNGTYGSSTVVPVITVSDKGLVTEVSNVPLQVSSSTTSGILSSTDYINFTNKLSKSSLADGYIWIGSDGLGASQKTISGDFTIGSDGSGRLNVVNPALPIVTLPEIPVPTSVKIPRITVSDKGIVTELTQVSLQTSSATNVGVLSSADWNTFNSKLGKTIGPGQIFVGSGTSIATARTVDGDATIDTSGILTLKDILQQSGTVGNDYLIPTIAYNKKGQITGIYEQPIPEASNTTAGILSAQDYLTFSQKVTGNLLSGNILIGNSSNVTTQRTMSGDVTIDNQGVTTLSTIHSPIPFITYETLTVPRLQINEKGLVQSITSSVIPTATSLQAGVLSTSDWITFNSKLGTSDFKGDGKILVGDGTNARSVSMGGDATINSNGFLTLASTIAGNKTIPGDISFTCTNGDISTDRLTSNVKIDGSVGVAGKSYFDSTMSTQDIEATSLSVGVSTFQSGTITNIVDPLNETDVVNKRYVDNASLGITWIDPVDVSTTQDISLSTLDPLSNGGTLDGKQLLSGNRVLVKSQTNKIENGIYIAASGQWTRSLDAATGTNVANYSVFVKSGTENGSSSFIVSSSSVIDSDEIQFTLFSKSSSISAGSGLTGITRFDVKVDGSTVLVDPITGNVRMASVPNYTAGTYGSSTSVASYTSDRHGRIISSSNIPLQQASYVSANDKKSGIITGDEYKTFTDKLDKSVFTSGKIVIGSGSGPSAVSISGDASLSTIGQMSLTEIHSPTVPTASNTGVTVPEITIDAKGRVIGLTTSTLQYASETDDGILSAADYTALNTKVNETIVSSDGHILVGDGVGANSVPMSGDATMTSAGELTIASTLSGSKTISGDLTADNLVATTSLVAPSVTATDVLADTFESTSGSVTVGSSVLTSGKLTGILTPVGGSDVANKDYVDQASTGITWKTPVNTRADTVLSVVNATGPVLSSGLSSTALGGYILQLNDRVLVNAQTDSAYNGVYEVTSLTAGAGSEVQLERASDFSIGTNIKGYAIYAESGTSAGLSYVISSSPAVVGTDDLVINVFAGSSSFSAGIATSKDVNSLNVNFDDSTIGVANNALYLKNNAVTSQKILDGSITSQKILDGSVTSQKILNGSVTGQKVASNTITNSNISSTAGITPSKLSTSKWSLSADSDLVLTGTLESGKVGLGETAKLVLKPSKVVTATTAQSISGSKTFTSDTKVTSTTALDRNTNNAALTVSGGAFISKDLEANSIYTDNAYISGSTTISGVTISETNNITGVNDIQATLLNIDSAIVGNGMTLDSDSIVGVNTVSGLVTPTLADHAANKDYVDSSIDQFTTRRNSVRCTTAGELTTPISGVYSSSLTSGVTVVDGDRILVKDQVSSPDNGIYIVNTTGNWARADDYPSGSIADGLSTFDENTKKIYVCTNNNATVGSVELFFEQLIKAGDGLLLTENELSIELADSTIILDAGKLKVGTIPVSKLSTSLINVSGSGISITDAQDQTLASVALGGTMNFGINLQTDSGLSITGQGLGLLNIPNSRLDNSSIPLVTTSSKGVIFKTTIGNEVSVLTLGESVVPEIKLQPSSNLTVDNTGLALALDPLSVTDANIVGLDGSKITATSIANNSLVNDNVSINVKPGSGVEISTDDGTTYENNGSLIVQLGSELNVKLSDEVTRNDVAGAFTAQKAFTNATASSGKTTGAITVTGGVGISGDLHTSALVADSATIANLTLSSGKISGITSVVNATDAVSKNYVDSLSSGFKWTTPVKYATTQEINIVANDYTGVGAALTMDGNSSWTVGDRVLVLNESDTSNGIYEVVSESSPTVILQRASDMATTVGATGLTVFVESGTVNAGIGFTCSAESPVEFVQFTTGDSTDAGNGLEKIGNVLNILTPDGTLAADGNGVTIANVPLGVLEESTINISSGSDIELVFKESNNSTLRSDAILGGYVEIAAGSNIPRKNQTNAFTSVTESTDKSTGSITLAGGLGVAKSIFANTVNATTLTDGTATLAGGSLSGVTTANIEDDITLSKGSTQSITSAQNLAISSTNGTVSVEGASFNGNTLTVSNIVSSSGVTVGGVNMSSSFISGAAYVSVTTDPTTTSHLTRKSYVDSSITTGINLKKTKDPVSFATSANLSGGIPSGLDSTGIDLGVGTLAVNDRVLIKNQVTKTQNGIYLVTNGQWSRTTDSASPNIGDTVTVLNGSISGLKTYVCTSVSEGPVYSILNGSGEGLTNDLSVDYDDVTINLSGNKLQVKQITPELISNRVVGFTYGDGIKSTANPLLGATTSFPVISADTDDVSLHSVAGKLTIKQVDIDTLTAKSVSLQDSTSMTFVDQSDSAITSVTLGQTFSVKAKLAPTSGLEVTASGLQVNTSTITDKISGIASNQITNLDGSKLTGSGSIPTDLLSSNSITVSVGPGIYVKDTGGSDVSSISLGDSVVISTDTLDPTQAQTFTETITFSKNAPSTDKLSGAILISNGGLGVIGNVNAGGTISSESGVSVGNVLISNGTVSGLTAPQESSEAATKGYVDDAVNGTRWEESVRCATTSEISTQDWADITGAGLSQTSTPHRFDGVEVVLNDRILVKNQAVKSQNGIYYVNFYNDQPAGIYTITLARAIEYDVGIQVAGSAAYINEGALYGKAGFVCTNDTGTDTVGTDPLTFTQIAGSATYTANDGLSLTGSQFNINANTDQFEFVSKILKVKSSGVTSTELGPSSVTETKIADLAVTNAKLQNESITVTATNGIQVKSGNEVVFSGSTSPVLGGTLHIQPDSSVFLKTDSNSTLTGTVSITDPTVCTSTSTGALNIVGGLGVQENIHSLGVTTQTLTATTLTDGTAVLTSGSLSGVTTADIEGDITLSKGSTQSITSAHNLAISSTGGTVSVEGLVFNAGSITGILSANIEGDITLSKGSTQSITSAQDLAITSTGGTVSVEDLVFDAGSITGITTASVDSGLLIGPAAGSKVNLSVKTGSGDTTINMKLPVVQGSAGSVMTNDGSGNLSWRSNNVLYSRKLVESPSYTVNAVDDIIAVKYTDLDRAQNGPVAITLPLISTVSFLKVTIVDEGGDANTNNISVYPSGSDTIIGRSTPLVINGNYNSYILYNDGVSEWFIM